MGGQLEGDTLLLCIRDNGPGIRPDELPRLFEHGFRGSESARHAGSGQGLPLARQMLAWQGGSLSVENQEGGGCRACLRLPRGGILPQASTTETVSA